MVDGANFFTLNSHKKKLANWGDDRLVVSRPSSVHQLVNTLHFPSYTSSVEGRLAEEIAATASSEKSRSVIAARTISRREAGGAPGTGGRWTGVVVSAASS